MNTVPKIAAIHDMSGVGRCSMTVILPILSALGCQVCPLPTAILSNHSEYNEFYFYDFTKHMDEYYKCWEKSNEEFDCIYSGFIGSENQINIILDIINNSKTKKKTLIVVDPVMGDHGSTYKTYTESMVEKMKELVMNADIITPNYTETCILLEEKYDPENISISLIKKYMKNLSDLGPSVVIITGVKTNDNEHMNVCFNKNTGKYYKIPFEYLNCRYPGTGDLFTSLFIGYLFKDKKLPEAIQQASQFVSLSVSVTNEAKTPVYEGVLFEKVMKELYNEINDYQYYEI